jgi:hypothetical protein
VNGATVDLRASTRPSTVALMKADHSGGWGTR